MMKFNMSRPEFEFRDANRLLTPDFLNYPRLHDLGRIAISSDLAGEYDVSLKLFGRYDRAGVINTYDDLNLVATSAESYHGVPIDQLDPLLLGIFSLEMHLRGVGSIMEVVDHDNKTRRNRELNPYRALFGDLYQVEHPHPDDMYVAVDLQSDVVVESLTTAIPAILAAQRISS